MVDGCRLGAWEDIQAMMWVRVVSSIGEGFPRGRQLCVFLRLEVVVEVERDGKAER